MRSAGLSLLVLAALLAGTPATSAHERRGATAISGYGISVTLPAGWQGRISHGMLEAATMPLPRSGSSPASSLSDALARDDIGVLLFEDAATPGVPFNLHAFERRARRPFTRHDFDKPGPSNPNRDHHRYARRGIRLSGRYFALFIETGDAQPTPAGLAGLNRLIRSLQVRAGDFYPGTVAPARFPATRGWYISTSPRVAVGPSTSTTSIAATVAYRDPLDAFPPHGTLAHLPASGVIICLQLSADDRAPPLGLDLGGVHGVHLEAPRTGCGGFEGIREPLAVCPLQVVVDRRYWIQGWVIYGRPDPTHAQQLLAQAELDRLELPTWPLWSAG